MFRALMDRWFRKETSVARAILALVHGKAIWTPTDFTKLSKAGYASNPYVYAAVRLRATACAGIPWILHSRNRKGELIRLQSHELLDLIGRPNPYQGRAEFIQALVGFLDLNGNSYVEEVGPDRGPPQELWTHRPDRIKILKGNEIERVLGYEYDGGSQKIAMPAARITHFRYWNPLDDWYGQSPLEAARKSIDHNNEIRAWNVSLLQNSARPAGFLVSKDSLDDPQFLRLKTQIDEEYSGWRNAGRPMLLESGLDWKQVGISPADMDWIEGAKISAREVAIAFGVPPEMLGDAANKTYANAAEGRKSFYQDAILPLMDFLRDGFVTRLVPKFGDNLHLDYNRDDIEALQEDREKRWMRVNNAPWLSINEKREATGYGPVPGGDVILVSAVNMPLDLVGSSAYLQPELPPGADQPAADSGSKALGPGTVRTIEIPAFIVPKAFNLPSREAKKQFVAYTLQARLGWERKLAKVFKTLLTKERAEIVKAILDAKSPEEALANAPGAIDPSLWIKAFVASYTAVSEDAGKRVLEGFKATGRPDVKAVFERYGGVVANFIATVAADKTRYTTETTKGWIREAIFDGMQAGESVNDIAERVSDVLGATEYRGQLIARTETTMAYGFGSHYAAKEAGVDGLKKEWFAVTDGITREDHLDADGQTVGIDEAYNVGGVAMLYPGDPTAPIEQLANCRCSETYVDPDFG